MNYRTLLVMSLFNVSLQSVQFPTKGIPGILKEESQMRMFGMRNIITAWYCNPSSDTETDT